MTRFSCCLILTAGLFFSAGPLLPVASAVDLPLPISKIQRNEPVDFATEIFPILKRNCLACHHEKEAEGGLVLESLAAIRSGGDSGEGVVAGDVSASQLFLRASGTEEPLMPPEDNSVGAQSLTPEELGLLKLWIDQGAKGEDASSSEMIQWQPIPESIRSVYAMDISADGSLAVVGRGNRIALFDLHRNEEAGRLVDPSLQMGDVADYDLIQSVAAAPDGRRIATGGYRAVRIWKRELQPIDPSSTPLASAGARIAVDHSQGTVAIANAIGDVEIWDLTGKERRQTLTGHHEPIVGLSFLTDGEVLLSGDQSGRLIAWDMVSGKSIVEFETAAAAIAMHVAADQKHVAVVDAAGTIHLSSFDHDSKSLTKLDGVAADIADARAVCFIGNETLTLAVATTAGPVKLISIKDNKTTAEINHGAPVDALAVTSDQAKLITGGSDGKTKIWNLADNKELLTLQGETETQLLVARVERDAARQKAKVAQLQKQTEELKKALAKEDEALKKTKEEHDKAKTNLDAEEKKRADAVALVTTTEARIAKANSDAEQANKEMEQSTKLLADAKAKTDAMTKELEANRTQLTSVEQEIAKVQAQIDALAKQKAESVAKAEQTKKVMAEQQAAIEATAKQATDAESKIEAAKKLAETSAAEAAKATKELEEQTKAVAAAEEAKKKSEAEVAKRKQAFDTATSAQARAAAAIPAHENVIAEEARRQQLVDRQLVSVKSVLADPGNAVVHVAVSPDDSTVLVAHQEGAVRAYHATSGKPILDFTTTDSSVPTQVAFAGDALVALSESASPRLIDRKPRWVLERTIGTAAPDSIISDRVTALDFRPDGMTLAVGSGPPSRFGDVKLFAIANGSLVRDFGEVHSDTVLGLEFSPDGRRIASAAADKTIRILDVATGSVNRSLEGHTHHVLTLDWQDDGQTIASGSADRTIKVWNVQTGEQRRTISGFSKEITAVKFVQTSNQIVSACADGNLRLSNTADGKSLRNFSAGGDFLFTLAVTPDGQKLMAAGQSGTVRLWNLADGKLLHEW